MSALPRHPQEIHPGLWRASQLGVPAGQACVLRAPRTAEALWAVEQILRAGTCGALLFWQAEVRQEALRRLHLAAQASDTLLFLFRPLAAAHATSPAPLRLALRAARGGIRAPSFKEKRCHRSWTTITRFDLCRQ